MKMFKHFIVNFSLAILGIVLLCLSAFGSGMLGAYLASVFELTLFTGFGLSLGIFLIIIIAMLAAIDTYEKRDRLK